jgi:predicted GIY-YIG superfamily endonuclease
MKFTKLTCQQEALKYQSRSQFYKLSKNIYSIALYYNWLDDICGHMKLLRKPKEYWTKEHCIEESLKYQNKNQFRKKSRTCFQISLQNGWLDEICSHMIQRRKLTKEVCKQESLKYKTRGEFCKNSPSAYNASIKNNWIDEICTHMSFIKHQKEYWTQENCHEEALKYTSRSDFSKNSSSSYSKAHEMKWLDNICSHMTHKGNKYKRCIYVYEFTDLNAYVGLTFDINKRNQQHQKRGPVFNHMKNTGLEPVLKKLTDYIDVSDAKSEEDIFIKKYIENGYKLLNNAKAGACGGGSRKWTKEKCKSEALIYNNIKEYRKNSLSYRAATRNKWLDEICSHMNRKKNTHN